MPSYDPATPIAIVGASCRLPGRIAGLDALWTALSSGADAVTSVPSDRFDARRFLQPEPARPGKTYTVAGGFLDGVTGFDADYFGITPREASRMDPQQRLLLELAVEAVDDAGIDPGRLAGSDAAVFVGVSSADYAGLQQQRADTSDIFSMSGVALTNTANRISYWLDLRGPSIAVDTACSSALVALHQACQQLRTGESAMALVGGINVLLCPSGFVGFSAGQMLSPTGHCHAFSANADGFVRAEGGGVVLLKPLQAALDDGDRVHAVLLGTGTNVDGHTAALALPSAEAQEALLRRVVSSSGAAPEEFVYFEAHGTGTPVGDPLECRAIGGALGQRRTEGRPLPIGSVKSNIGHLEPASGMAGLLKAILVLRHRAIPPSLHAQPLNPDIDFTGLGLEPVTSLREIDPGERALVGVNSFGFGGANATAVLTGPPEPPREPKADTADGLLPLVVSARSRAALVESAQRFADRLETAQPAEFYDICHTASMRRGRHPHRLVVLGRDPAEAADRLLGAAADSAVPGAGTARAVRHGRVAFVFSGNGSQWAGMGADLLDSEPAFANAVKAVDAEITRRTGWSVVEELTATAERSRLDRTEFAQPALFAVQVGLVELLREHGIEPGAVLGHSVGEVAAAYVAGAFDLSEAVELIVERARVQEVTAGQGRMAAVGLAEADARAELTRHGDALELAAVNSGTDVTVSGDPDALAALEEELATRGVFCRRLDLNYAFHSHVMDQVEPELRRRLAALNPRPTRIPMISTVTGGAVDGTALDADYWWRNVRHPVAFAPAVRTAIDDGFDVLVEIGPHPVLSTYLRRLSTQDEEVAVVPVMRRQGDGPGEVATAVATLVAAGGDVDWARYFPRPGAVVDLPAYPWQRQEHWNGDPNWWAAPLDHPLLGSRLSTIAPTWEGPVDLALVPWLAEHRIADTVVMPAAGYVEMALAAGRLALETAVELDALHIPQPLVVPEELDAPPRRAQVSLSDEDGILRVASRGGSETTWQLHARGRVRPMLGQAPEPLDLDALRARLTGRLDAHEYYRRVVAAGLEHGPVFQVLDEGWLGPGEVLARYGARLRQTGYELDPVLLDGALQVAGSLAAEGGDETPHLPVSIGRVRRWRPMPERGFLHARLTGRSPVEIKADVLVLDEHGEVAARLDEVRLHRFRPDGGDPVERLVTVSRAADHLDEPAAPSPLPGSFDPATETGELLNLLRRDAQDTGNERYLLRGKELIAHFAATALAELCGEGELITIDRLLEAGMAAKYRGLARSLMGLAERHRLLESGRMVRPAAPAPLFQALMRDFPYRTGETVLIAQGGDHLADVLREQRSPVELFFGNPGMESVEHFFDQAPGCLVQNRLAAAAVRAVVAAWPADRPLRVLEVGAGTGGTTAAVLPELPADRAQYVFTDVSETFLSRAESRFADYGFVSYRRFDLEQDPHEQDFAEAAFDLVLASNVIHATRDVRATLHRLGGLISDGGHLLATELHDPDQTAVNFALFDGWWAFTDTDLRQDGPLLPFARWRELLADTGFTDIAGLGLAEESEDNDHSTILARRVRRAVPPAVASLPPGSPTTWVIAHEHAEDADFATTLADLLTAAGNSTATVVAAGSDWPPTAGELGLVLITGAGADGDPAAATELTLRRAEVLRRLATDPAAAGSFWLVTGSTHAVPGARPEASTVDAAVWGVARSLANEVPELAVRRISLDRGDDPAADARRLARELLAPGTEDEVVLSPGGRFLPRTLRCAPPVVRDLPCTLDLRDQGFAYRLAWVQAQPVEPGPGEVVISVRAAGLNYRDVLWANGVLPTEAMEGGGFGCGLGLECAGVVTAIGPGVSGVAVGQRVSATARQSFASHVLARASRCVPIPAGTSFAEAATMPVAFVTVSYALNVVARLLPGETVLVHGGAGGVGLAAIQYAHAVGARVIATAGTPAKRDFLRLLGVDHVLDSRGLEFAEQVMDLTEGRGVNVVLNSLSGEAMSRSLEVLAPGGRFIELGKRDLYENKPVLLRPFRNNLALCGVDVDQLDTEFPELADHAFAAVAEKIQSGEYRPLPHRCFPARRVGEAFHLLQHSRHIGKVVVTFDEPVPVESRPRGLALDPDATYLVTGGLGGFGAATALWLADRGARHLALVSRRGAEAPEARETLAALAERGASATAHSADVTDPAAMRAVLDAVSDMGHPLRGVVHAAMVLDDAPLRELTPERFRAAVEPKMRGALVLDELTRGSDLEFFLAFSSATALLGNVHQANYVAGNLFLEALARRRRCLGLPALAVSWGVIGDVGYVARSERTARSTAIFGARPISPAEAFTVLDEALGQDGDVVTAGRFSWDRLRDLLPTLDVPRLAAVLPPKRSPKGYGSLRRTLVTLGHEEARLLVEDAIAELIAGVLRTTPDQIDRHRKLDQLGMDSLMGAELFARIRSELGCEVPVMQVLAAAGISDLAGRVVTRLKLAAAQDEAGAP
ncbi:SDR family NAD(P)-dependent oxidoreductase [Allokutzneria oryzae]|uniref:SDR family NAD(P)-dependent oxidoreductase n=1 Tax=Allokutzneria oryzae TaxID=1378989 RepID=A0ABV5ZZX6_9PSEU